jgi:hypothetical protein
VRRLIRRTAALALSVTLVLGAGAVPCAAETTPAKAAGKLTRLSPASRQVLMARTPVKAQQAGPSTPGSFFKSTRGKVTLALMGAGTILTLWSIQHDRKPVKSPVR